LYISQKTSEKLFLDMEKPLFLFFLLFFFLVSALHTPWPTLNQLRIIFPSLKSTNSRMRVFVSFQTLIVFCLSSVSLNVYLPTLEGYNRGHKTKDACRKCFLSRENKLNVKELSSTRNALSRKMISSSRASKLLTSLKMALSSWRLALRFCAELESYKLFGKRK